MDIKEIRKVYESYSDMRFCKLGFDKRPCENGWNSDVSKFKKLKDIITEPLAGILLGGPGNYLCVDIDNNFYKHMQTIERILPINTLMIESGGSTKDNPKFHLYYKIIGDDKGFVGRKVKGFGDIKYKATTGNAAQVVIAGTKHKSGKYYTIRDSSKIQEIEIDLIIDLVTEIDPKIKLNTDNDSTPYDGLIMKSEPRIKKLLENKNMMDKVGNKTTGIKNDCLFPNIAAFLYYNPEFEDSVDYLIEACKYTRGEFNGRFRGKTPYINTSQLDEFFELFIEDKEFIDNSLNVKKLDYYMNVPDISKFLILKYLESNTFNYLIGQGGGGKSFLAAYEACCIASGDNFLGKKVKKGRVLVLDNENIDRGIKHRYSAIIKGMGLNKEEIFKNLYFLRVGNLNDDLLVRQIKHYVKHNKISYMVVDTMRSHFGGTDENSGKDMGSIAAIFNNLKVETGVTIKLLHHTNKSNNYSGHTTIKTNCDNLLISTFNSKVRDELHKTLWLKFDSKENKERYGDNIDSLTFEINLYSKWFEYDMEGEIVKDTILNEVKIKILTNKDTEAVMLLDIKSVLNNNLISIETYSMNELLKIVQEYRDYKPATIRGYIYKLEEMFDKIKEGRNVKYKLKNKIILSD